MLPDLLDRLQPPLHSLLRARSRGGRGIGSRPGGVCLRRARSALVTVLAALGLVTCSLACGSGAARTHTSAGGEPLPASHRSIPTRTGWLGLDLNSSSRRGGIDDFAKQGIVFDRSGPLEVRAGHTVSGWPELAHGLATSIAAGMVPDVYVDPAQGPVGCTRDPNGSAHFCLPVSPTGIDAYVQGFVATAGSILHSYPRHRFLFEPMNEPWGWASPPGTLPGRQAAAEYAAVIARLLPAARTAGIPLSEIYVASTGTLTDGSSWVPDLYLAQPCLKPGPSTCGPIEGWNTHPYGLPDSTTEGIGVLPTERAAMLSGQDNIIVSEIGFCATDVGGGQYCNENRADIVGSSAQTRAWLARSLEEALAMHRAGWLRALMIWSRGSGGWAMQNPDGSLTPAGATLVRFAARS